MQIGEFAKICKTKISVLRHYDKEGLLSPDYVDRFTGYRYYSEEQIPIFLRISALKKAGFSLAEIRQIVSSRQSDERILSLFENKKAELLRTLEGLKEAEGIILFGKDCDDIEFFDRNGRQYARSLSFDKGSEKDIMSRTDAAIRSKGYQRISPYSAEDGRLVCRVIKLSDHILPCDDINIEFEDDPSVVGRWETVGEYAVKEDFYNRVCCQQSEINEIYFLPHGKPYWCYSWSRGRLIFRSDGASFVDPYVIEEIDGESFMLVEHKSYEYLRGGRPTVLALRRADRREYSLEEIAKRDDIDLPFVPDDEIIGKWRSVAFCRSPEEFESSKEHRRGLFFRAVEFKANGDVTSYYAGKTVSGSALQSWTKGYILSKLDHTACGYRITRLDGVEYLFLEWKSGDYVYGHRPPEYYVFIRDGG